MPSSLQCAQFEILQRLISHFIVFVWQDVSKDRFYSGQLGFDAEMAKSNGTPWETVYLMVDTANQNNFATLLGASNAHGGDDR